MKKSFLFGLLAIGLAGFGFGGVSMAGKQGSVNCNNSEYAIVYIGEDPDSGCYSSLDDAIKAADAGNTITLKKDIKSNHQITINKAITLDGANYTLTVTHADTTPENGGGLLISANDVTVENLNVVGPNGTKEWVSNQHALKVYGASNVVLNNISVDEGSEAMHFNNSSVKLEGNITVGENCLYAGFEAKNSTVDVTEATIEKEVWIWDNDGKTSTVNGGAQWAQQFKDDTEAEIQWRQNAVATVNNVSYTTLEAAIEAAEAGETVTLLGNVESDHQITINKAIILDGANHILTVTHENRTKENGGGLLISADGVTVENLTVVGPNGTKSWISNQHALKVYGASNVTLNNISVDEGSEAMQFNNSSVTLKGNITVGENCLYAGFEAKNSTVDVTEATIEKEVWIWDNDGKTSTVNGGAQWVKQFKDDTEAEIQWWQNAVATVNGISYASLEAAIAAATDESTITLLSDVTVSSVSYVDITKEITINLNGYYIHYATIGWNSIRVVNGGNLTINDETGNGGIDGSYAAILIYGDGTEINIPQLTINGGTLKGKYYAVSGNGSKHNTIIEINGGTLIGGVNEGDFVADEPLGIYHPQAGEITINGGTVQGYTSALEIRAGNLVINDGTFISTSLQDPTVAAANGNGSTTNGAAIAVAQHNTKLPISVEINGGTFNGVSAFFQSNPQNNTYSSSTKVESVIGSGIFNGKVGNSVTNEENYKLTITGGIFSYDPADYIDEGYTVLQKGGKYHVMSLADAATDESNAANVQLPEGVIVNTGAGDVVMDLSDDITDYLSGTINTDTSVIEEGVLTGEIKDAGYQNVVLEGTVLLDFGGNAIFSRPIAIRIPVTSTNPVKVKVKHGTDAYGYTGLTLNPDATCDGSVASSAYTGTDINPVNGFAVIYTCSASTFVAYTESNPAPRSSGGGSSSYSCKNLPANAVANNTTKPKKNTDYSYSTDTGAVCTFQCKTGYTWNEKDAKCEKATETVADTNDTTVAENTENADTSDSASTEDLQKVLEDGYNVEFHKAYEFAFQNGITTMPTIEEADMNGNLNRIAMAKMLSQYAINILGKTPDTTREVPNFPDVDAQLDADYNNGVTLAYQLGIMGINIDEFRPFDLVTRAEFGTALSRMLFGLADGEGDAYYLTHLEKLMSEGIITNNDPRLEELRGYVMIMLMRSASK